MPLSNIVLENKLVEKMIEEIFKSKFIVPDNWTLCIPNKNGGNNQILSISPKLKTQERIELLNKIASCLNNEYEFPKTTIWDIVPYHSISLNGIKVATVYKTGLGLLTLPVLTTLIKKLNGV